MNHNTYVTKPCETCEYLMREVTPRRRWCKQCIAARFSRRINSAPVRANMRRAHFEIDCRVTAAMVDQELTAPTRYWESR